MRLEKVEACFFVTFAMRLARFHSLIYLDFSYSMFKSLPNCTGDLLNLRSIALSRASTLEYIPKEIFTLPKLKMLVLFQSALSYETFPQIEGWSDSLVGVFLQDNITASSVCKNYGLLSEGTQAFIDHFDACWEACSDPFDTFTCPTYSYLDGKCDDACFTPSCNFDGGDCSQLCECQNSSLLTNGVCDVACNTTACDYDLYACVEYSKEDVPCGNSSYLCYESWLGDGWCDSNCQMLEWETGDVEENANCWAVEEPDCDGCTGQFCLFLFRKKRVCTLRRGMHGSP